MDRDNAPHVNFIFKSWPGQNLGAFRLEAPKPAEWDQLLTALGLTDAQALEAVNSDGETGEQLRKFVLTGFRQYFVPEVVIKAVRRRGILQSVVAEVDQITTVTSNTAAMIAAE
jgi:hypothetical protein